MPQQLPVSRHIDSPSFSVVTGRGMGWPDRTERNGTGVDGTGRGWQGTVVIDLTSNAPLLTFLFIGGNAPPRVKSKEKEEEEEEY